MAAFNFLPQHIVANPFVLFYKTETTEHREKLRTVFPLVIGAIDSAFLQAEHEAEAVAQRIRDRIARLERRSEAARAWEGEAFALYGRARELSLLPEERKPATLAECLVALRRVAATRELPAYQAGSAETASDELRALRRRDADLDQQLGDLRRQLIRLQDLREEMMRYSASVGRQSGRLDSVGWLQRELRPNAPCPLCKSVTNEAATELALLEEAASQLANELKAVENTPAVLAKEETAVLEEIVSIEDSLRSVRETRAELESSLSKEAGHHQRLEEVFRFIGRLEQAVSNFALSADDSTLALEVKHLQEQHAELRKRLDSSARNARERAALRFVSQQLGRFAGILQLERADDIIELRVRQLSLSFEDPRSGRQDYLWEIGSGENWMGYHLATLLSLHALFKNAKTSPVPSFLIIDQPSQVYFPAGTFDAATDQSSAALSNDERKLRRVFELLGDAAKSMGIQIIVLEHAPPQVWNGLEHVHLVQEWRVDVDLLIPRAWLDQEKQL
jgi:chromosome segregation ATPase